jgi:hypothetical protein
MLASTSVDLDRRCVSRSDAGLWVRGRATPAWDSMCGRGLDTNVHRLLHRYLIMSVSLVAPVLATGCSAESPDATPRATTAERLADLAPAALRVDLDPARGGVVRGTGVSFAIAPGTVFTPGGRRPDLDTDGDGVADATRVRGVVSVELRELLSPEAMIEAGRPTVTTAGELLESGGAFDLTIRSGDTIVQVTKLLDLSIKPDRAPSSNDGMIWWLADTTSDAFGWQLPPSGEIAATSVAAGFTFPSVPWGSSNRVNGAGNCDKRRVTSLPKLASFDRVRVQVAGATEGDAAVFFVPDDSFSVIRLDRDPSGVFVGPAAAMAATSGGTMIAFTTVDGALRFDRRSVSVATVTAGDTMVLRPAELAASDLRAELHGL